ncbi:MAG: MBL fold metallo-hydrolase, partial [Roseiflexaceae bacterium]|nr:MBL fold metallo-hydrolase [Roseiflexaceae bacterium]
YPTHYGGSPCGGKGMSGKPSSTIGYERRYNPLLGASNLAAFQALLDETPRSAIDAILHNRNTNRGELPLPAGYGEIRAELGAIRAFTLQQASALLRDGTALIDLRDRLAFARWHPAGALSTSYSRESLAGRVAALAAAETPLLLFADWPFLARYAASLLTAAGRNPIYGFVDATPEQWQQASLPGTQLDVLSVDQLHQEVMAGTASILDVRAPFELAQGAIPGAQAIPFDELRERLHELPGHRRLVVVCESGIRSVGSASLLARQGFGQVAAVAPQGMSEYLKRHPAE